jgi:hypothetical protein
MELQPYGRIIKGENAITMQIVCKDGAIRTVTTEQFTDGFHAYLTKEDGHTYTNHKGYATSRKAINAAAKW